MDITSIQNTLVLFGINQEVSSYILIQETVESEKEKLIILVKTMDGSKYICRYYGGNHFSETVIEQQSYFAYVLQKNGIITPNKYNCKGSYCLPFTVGNKKYLTTVEDFLAGNNFGIDLQLFEKLGRLLGCLHRISEKVPTKIDYSAITDSIVSGKARFEAILNKTQKIFEISDCITEIGGLHDGLVNKLSKSWCTLPCGSVHGDLSVFNNIIEVDGSIGIIDFDLAGNETYLSDLLITFYSSLYKYYPDRENRNINVNKAYKMFFRGYLSQRKLTKTEISVFPEMAALFDGLYFSKMLLSEWNQTHESIVLKQFDKAYRHFNVYKHLYLMEDDEF